MKSPSLNPDGRLSGACESDAVLNGHGRDLGQRLDVYALRAHEVAAALIHLFDHDPGADHFGARLTDYREQREERAPFGKKIIDNQHTVTRRQKLLGDKDLAASLVCVRKYR